MSDQTQVHETLSSAVKSATTGKDPRHLSIESMALLINASRLKTLEKKITNEFIELKKRQDQVSILHKLIKTINAAMKDDGFDCSNDQNLKDLLTKVKEYGVELDSDKHKYTKEEKDRLVENIRLTADDFTVLNDMQLQTISRLTTERYESYQLARAIMKPLHEDKINKSRAIAGR